MAKTRGSSLRTRITAGAAAVVAVGLVLGALGFYFALNASLTASTRSMAQNDADAIAAQIDARVDVYGLLQALNDAAIADDAPDAADEEPADRSGSDEGSGSNSNSNSNNGGDEDDSDAESEADADADAETDSDSSADSAADSDAGDVDIAETDAPQATNAAGEPSTVPSEPGAAPAPPAAEPSASDRPTAVTTEAPTALPTGLPTAPDQLDSLLDVDGDRYVQILAADGTVLASEPDDVVPEDFVSARAHTSGDGAGEALTVVAGRNVAPISDALGTVGWLLAVSVPLLVALVALTTWVVVGRALAPVDRMRRELESVTAAELSQRIEQPGNNDEIDRLAHTMNGMLDRLETAQRSQRRFISDASHELKSPLASLRQYAEVARAHPERIGSDELSDAVLDEGARLEHLVQGMLVLARSDEHALPLSVADVDLDDLVLAEAKRLRELGRVAVDTSAVAAARVQGDSGLLRQLVRNLADNAARHAATTVWFELHETEAQIVFVVRDDGEGIAEGDRERVFERFVRLDDARGRASGGSGLGLAIVTEIARAHQGTVAVLAPSLGNSGAVFEVRMPRAGGLGGHDDDANGTDTEAPFS